MVIIQLFFGIVQIQIVFGVLMPWNICEPFEIGSRHGVFSLAGLHVSHAAQLALGCLLCFFCQIGFAEPTFQLIDTIFIIVSITQFIFDGFELLTQHVFALVLAHLLFDLGVDALAHLEHLELTRQKLVKEDTRAFESLSEKLGTLREISKYGKSLTFVEDEQQELLSMPLEEYKRVIAEYLAEPDMTWIIIGDGETQLEPVKSFAGGDVTLLDIFGDPVEAEAPQAERSAEDKGCAESNAEAQARRA